MSVERRGGMGGYGAIASDNTDLRGPRYGQHDPVSRTLLADGRNRVKCLRCGEVWYHDRYDREFPPECQKTQPEPEAEDPTLVELNEKWRTR